MRNCVATLDNLIGADDVIDFISNSCLPDGFSISICKRMYTYCSDIALNNLNSRFIIKIKKHLCIANRFDILCFTLSCNKLEVIN